MTGFQVSIPCGVCPAKIAVGDQFCAGCGRPVTDQDRQVLQVRLEGSDYQAYERGKKVRSAASWIGALAILFAISGMITSLLASDGGDPTSEPYLELVANFILAALMGVLWLWARRAPLPAISVAFALFIVVQVGSALVDPGSILSGMIIKILAVAALTRGLMAALEARAALRRPAP